MEQINWLCKHFNQLTASELYVILQLRNEVFVVEQNCVFQDADDKDQECYHLCGFLNGQLAAYARLVPAGVGYREHIAIGRVITSPKFRNSGLGRHLMQRAIEACNNLFGTQTIKIGAQQHLEHFYGSFGFKQVGEPYLEDNIPHIVMLLMQ